MGVDYADHWTCASPFLCSKRSEAKEEAPVFLMSEDARLHASDACRRRRRLGTAAQVLLEKGVEESKILFLTLIAAPRGHPPHLLRVPEADAADVRDRRGAAGGLPGHPG